MIPAMVWVVGGGRIQEPLIREFASRGKRVAVGDADPACWATRLAASGLPIETFMVDTSDPEAHLAAVGAYLKFTGEPLEGVATAGTDAGPTVSLIAAAYGLPAAPYEVARRVKRKDLMREALGGDHPWFAETPLEYPCIVKPVDESASRGVGVVAGPADLDRALGVARMASHSGKVLFEELLRGAEVSTDWMVVDGFPIYVNGATRVFEGVLETGWTNPFFPTLAVRDLAKGAAAALGVTTGPFKLDLIEDPRYGWCVLEAATRWSGSFDHTLGATLSTGRNLSAALADYALGLPFDTSMAFTYATVHRHAAGFTPLLRGPYRLTQTMLGEIALNLGVETVIPLRWTGMGVTNLAERPLFIIATGPTGPAAYGRARDAWQGWLSYEATMNLGGGDS